MNQAVMQQLEDQNQHGPAPHVRRMAAKRIVITIGKFLRSTC
jgi:hypothetical protein